MAFQLQELIQLLLPKADAISTRSALLGFSVFLLFWAFYSHKRNAKLPPGPFPFPILGNLHQFGTLPHRALYELSKKYGSLMFLRLGSFPAVVVSSSEMAEEFLKTHDLAFANRPTHAAAELIGYNSRTIGTAPYGAYWRNMTKLCVTELLSAKRIETFRSIREEEVSSAVHSIWEKSNGGTVQVNVGQALFSINCAVIWRMLTGRKYSTDDVDGGGEEVSKMVHDLTSTMGKFNIGDFIPSIDWMDLQGLKRRMRRVHKFFDRMVEKIIDEHVERRKQNGEKSKHAKDIVDALLDLMDTQTMDMEITHVNIKAILFDMLTSGMESTATTLEWTMSALLQNPRVAKKLQQEIQSVVGNNRLVNESDVEGMEYLNCVIKESLRLYPTGPLMIPHESKEACTVGPQGYVLPAKTKLFVNAWAIARDPTVWEDALEFKPERFVGRNIDIVKGQEFDMLPFGAGRRRCPGGHMAMKQLTITLAQFMHCFDWRVEGNPSDLDMTEVFGATMPRKNNLFAYPSLKLSISL